MGSSSWRLDCDPPLESAGWLSVDVIRFLGEQDGPPQREFKRRAVELLQETATIRRAYLARVAYDQSPRQHVALCIASDAAQELDAFLAVADLFAEMFPGHAELDQFLLDPEMESGARLTCRPFYTARRAAD